jgi:hypothetical protein
VTHADALSQGCETAMRAREAQRRKELGNGALPGHASALPRPSPRLTSLAWQDFDIAGVYDPMVPDAEILLILVEALDALGIENFTVKLNHRKILDGLFAVCGVPADKTRAISSAVDKLDKSPWSEVRREMTVDKGLDEQVADRIGEYVKLKGEWADPCRTRLRCWLTQWHVRRCRAAREALCRRRADGQQDGLGGPQGHGAALRLPRSVRHHGSHLL